MGLGLHLRLEQSPTGTTSGAASETLYVTDESGAIVTDESGHSVEKEG